METVRAATLTRTPTGEPLYTVTTLTSRELAVRGEPSAPAPRPARPPSPAQKSPAAVNGEAESWPASEPVATRKTRRSMDVVPVVMVLVVLATLGVLAGLVYAVVLVVSAVLAWLAAHAVMLVTGAVALAVLLALLGAKGCPGLHCGGCRG